MSPCAFLLSTALLLPMAQPKAAPKTQVDRDHAVKIALAHLNIDKNPKVQSPDFSVRVRLDKFERGGIEALEKSQWHGTTRHKDAGGLPDSFEVFEVAVQRGLLEDTFVYVTKEGGRVVLVRFVDGQ